MAQKSAKPNTPSIFSLLGSYKGMIIFLVLLALASNLLTLILPRVISHSIDSFIRGSFSYHTTTLYFLLLASGILVLMFLQNIVQVYASEKVARDLRTKLSTKISRGSYLFIQKSNPSTLLTYLTSDVDSVKMFVAQAVSSLISSFVIIIGASVMLLNIDWKLGLAVMTIIPIIAFTFFIILGKVRILFTKSREVIDWLNKVINESILGAALIRVLNSKNTEHDKFDVANSNAKSLGLKILGYFSLMIPVITFVANLGTLIILALGGHFVINSAMSIGDFTAFNSYVAILIFPIFIIGFMMNIISQASASYARISNILEADEIADTGSIKESIKGYIDVKDVTVRYGEKDVLKHVSFHVEAGSRTAIIGPTAAGKSQLLYLLTALTVPTSGVIEYDHRAVDTYDSEVLHRQIGFVFQDSIMFNLSIKENIAFNNTVTDESLEKAIQTAELQDFLGTLPAGLSTVVSERGSSLSGGQKQRIMLARALALDPKVLLLDDFTARVDGETEKRILTNIAKNYPHLTLVSVTQKIASVQDYDEIILLMEGEVVAKGKHEELMECLHNNCKFIIHKEVLATMNYKLNTTKEEAGAKKKVGTLRAFASLWPLLANEKKNLILAFCAIIVNSLINLFGPFIIGRTVDKYVLTKQYHGVVVYSGILLGMFAVGLVASYLQTKWMGSVSQRTLFKLRNTVFNKLQDLPVAFFNQNKAGDLISRINNDTDKLNQFFSQSLMQFIGSIFIMIGAGIFLLTINFKLGGASLLPAVFILILTQVFSPWIKRKNAMNLKSTGDLSAEIQESLNNFKVIVAFNRRDYFRKRFEESNQDNYKTSVGAGIANNFFAPIYSFASTLAQLIMITFSIYLILHGQFTLGLLISFLSYLNNFYNPLRQLAALWANFQTAIAGWDRINAILAMDNDLTQTSPSDAEKDSSSAVLSFKNVHFGYPDGKEILHNVNFNLLAGKTYALVGPTGGGKTTTASLMARIFDPTKGLVFLDGKDIRSYTPAERAKKIGFILQEPFLFTGTVKENIIYGNEEYQDFSKEDLEKVIKEASLESLLSWFDKGLDTPVSTGGETISLGQRQLIAFVRAVLRKPELLILDEATANIDTVTEQLLEDILKKLPKETTRVIIAHRLNTIENADEIFFVNSGKIVSAGSMDHAVEMLLHGQRKS